MKILSLLLLSVCLVTTNLFSAETPQDPKFQVKIATALRPSLVQVEYQLQHDKGELPNKAGWGERCPNCGQFHSNGVEDLVKNEQPLSTGGFLISSNRVVSKDVQTHARFIKNIRVRQGDKFVSAKVVSYAVDQNAVILELAEALPDSKPLKFEAEKKGPFFAAQYQPLNGEWNVSLKPVSDRVVTPEHSDPFISLGSAALLVDKAGVPVAISMKDELPLNESWKGSPTKSWTMIDAAKMSEMISAVNKAADASIVRVQLNFRSPKATDQNTRAGYGRSNQEENETEKNVTGLVIGDKKVLILAELKPKLTARLQRITVFGADGKSVPAKFQASLKDYGAFVATIDSPVTKAPAWSSEPILKTRNQLLLAADVAVKGEKRVAYHQHARIASFTYGWRNQVYPEIADKDTDIYLFNLRNELVALPISRRDRSTKERYSTTEDKNLTAATYLEAVLANLEKHSDVANAPLSEEEENRLAWLGIELQPMTEDLARVNQVSEYTDDGDVGAMVTHVYEGSPAAKAGIEAGYILLRLRTASDPAPFDVKLQDNAAFQEAFPWDRLDELQDRYFDRVPSPWPSVENTFTRQLTDLGVGTEYTAEFFNDGKIVEKTFSVTAGPVHYNSAPRFKTDLLGLTVRNLTYEVRRYLQRREEEPGIVISKIEPGSKAAVAGIKPYEVITHINEKPVKNVNEFESLLAIPGDLNISVKRMAKGRIVKISAPVAATD